MWHWLAIAAIIVITIMGLIRSKKISDQEKEKNEVLKSQGVIVHDDKLIHMTGLPIAEGMLCSVFYYADKINIKASNIDINVDMQKIVDISIKTETEIQKAYVSSAGGAVAGALIGGALGAIIGGRPKAKNTTVVHQYLIFTYKKDEDLQYFSFDCTNSINCYAIRREFNNSTQSQIKTHIEL